MVEAGRILRCMLEKVYIAVNEFLKAILVKTKKKMKKRNILLNNGRKAILVIKWQITWMNCVCMLVLY